MWDWLRKPRLQAQTGDPPLRGAPVRPRTKTYSADTGLVYQYAYCGYRDLESRDARREHVFTISRDRTSTVTLRIGIEAYAVHACEQLIGRPLLNAEQYAIAKLTLFSVFDQVPDLTSLPQPIRPDAPQMQTYLQQLGRV